MNGDAARPDPDALLRSVHAEAARAQQGRLKIFFGMAPGVGKTYAMLESARRLVAQGVDVVVGWVETHGRAETAALAADLERLPPRAFEHKGKILVDFDIDAALARRPRVLLLDELAHTNAPGARHAKRWQDVLDLLEAGLDVHTTLNVQHVESLNDVVQRITGVRVRETVPDQVLDRADEIELVDLPPDELLVRLSEGKVYVPEQAARARRHFFGRGNLLALRELALRRTADRVEADVQAYREEHGVEQRWETGERLLVCVGDDPGSAGVIRAARRLAERLPASWRCVHVETADRPPLSPAARERVNAHLRLAESLGAETAWLAGDRAVDVILEDARRHHKTRILVGQSTRAGRFAGLGAFGRFFAWLSGSLVDDLLRKADDIELLVVPPGPGEHAAPAPARRKVVRPSDFLWVTLVIALTTAIGHVARDVIGVPDVVMLYLLAIVVAALRFGTGPSLVGAALSVLAYDVFFVPPYLELHVADTRYLLSFVTMFGIGAVISALAGRIRQQAEAGRAREARASALYRLARDLSLAIDAQAVAASGVRHLADTFEVHAALMVRAGDALELFASSPGLALPLAPSVQAVATWTLDHLRSAGIGADALPGADAACFPLSAGPLVLGVVVLLPRGPGSRAALERVDERQHLDPFVRQIALAFDRARAAEGLRQTTVRARTEELRSSLLASVSHDLRTPLAVITGAATALRTPLPEPERATLVESIVVEARRMERLIGNLLDMTRLDAGGVEPSREWVPLDEVVGAALTRLEHALGPRPVIVRLDEAAPRSGAGPVMLHVDPVLIQQVLVNVLENAIAYTPAGSPIEIVARRHDEVVLLEVADRGPGLAPGDEERVFERFQRGASQGAASGPRGVGLGLAVSRGIMTAHGGTIGARNRPDGGAAFTLRLPLEEPPAVEAAA